MLLSIFTNQNPSPTNIWIVKNHLKVCMHPTCTQHTLHTCTHWFSSWHKPPRIHLEYVHHRTPNKHHMHHHTAHITPIALSFSLCYPFILPCLWFLSSLTESAFWVLKIVRSDGQRGLVKNTFILIHTYMHKKLTSAAISISKNRYLTLEKRFCLMMTLTWWLDD